MDQQREELVQAHALLPPVGERVDLLVRRHDAWQLGQPEERQHRQVGLPVAAVDRRVDQPGAVGDVVEGENPVVQADGQVGHGDLDQLLGGVLHLQGGADTGGGICDHGQAAPGALSDLAVLIQLGQYLVVIGRVADDRHPGEILGCGPQQGDAANIDLLDGVGQGHIRPADGFLEWVEVADDQLDCGDALGL